MIQHLKRNQINIDKYNACVESALNSRIYAYSWYLDIVADNWDVLVLNDYEAVMPLPYARLKRKLFFKKIVQPSFCQQLGFFFRTNEQQTFCNSFVSAFLKLKPVSYNFNTENNFEEVGNSKGVFKRINFELNLFDHYESIHSKYSKNLKRNINKANQMKLVIVKNIPLEALVKMKIETKKHWIKKVQFNRLKLLMEKLISKNKGTSYGVYYKKELVATTFFINEENRITHLISSTTKLGRDVFAIPFLFDNIIKENHKINLIFDFEGSMIPGVARFFKSFGALPKDYNSFKK